jgi:F0F1-type ATP synthase membrane subunit c/vacuolar-type H+-ATPase subunit K
MTKLSGFKFAIPLLVLAMLPMSGPAQAARLATGAGGGIGEACQGMLVAYARNPSLRNTILDIGFGVIEGTLEMTDPRARGAGEHDQAIGAGLITAGFLVAYASNPSIVPALEQIADACRATLEKGVVERPDLPSSDPARFLRGQIAPERSASPASSLLGFCASPAARRS